MSPLKNAAGKAGASMKSSFSSGARAGFTASGGKISGSSGAAAPTAAATAPTGAATSAPPAWAQSMKRQQTMNRGVSSVTHAVRSGDRGGGGASVDLSQKD